MVFRVPLMADALLKQEAPDAAAQFEQTPDYIGAKTAQSQEKSSLYELPRTAGGAAALGLAGGGALGLLGGAGGSAGAALGSGLTAPVGAAEYLGAGAGATGAALGSGIAPGVASEAIGGGALGTGLGGGAAGGLSALGVGTGLGAAGGAAGTNIGSGMSVDAYGNVTAAPAGTDIGGGMSVDASGNVTGAGAAPGGAGAAAGGATKAAAGGSFVDRALAQMKQNALGLGLLGLGTAASISGGKRPIPNEQQLNQLGADASATAHNLISQYNSGQLAPGQQASLDQLTQNTKNQLRQYFASIGQSNSTAAMQAEAQVDQQTVIMKQQMLDNALQNGLQALGVATGPLNTVANYQVQQDKNLQQAFGNFAQGIGQIFGRGSAATSPTQPQSTSGNTATQPTGVVTSSAPEVG